MKLISDEKRSSFCLFFKNNLIQLKRLSNGTLYFHENKLVKWTLEPSGIDMYSIYRFTKISGEKVGQGFILAEISADIDLEFRVYLARKLSPMIGRRMYFNKESGEPEFQNSKGNRTLFKDILEVINAAINKGKD